MAEYSYFWGGSTIGDALAYAPIEATKFSNFLYRLFGFGDEYYEVASGGFTVKISEGVISGQFNELAPSWAAGNFSVNSGIALVDGHIYKNDTSAPIAMAAPGAGTYYYLGGILSDPATKTCRLAKIGPQTSPAALVQPFTHEGQYFMVVACVSITSGGVATIIDVRRFIHANGNKVPALIKRQGGSPSNWFTAGNNAYNVGDGLGMFPLALYDSDPVASASGAVYFLPLDGYSPGIASNYRFEKNKVIYIATPIGNALNPTTTFSVEEVADNVSYLYWATYDGSLITGPQFYILALGEWIEYAFYQMPNTQDPII